MKQGGIDYNKNDRKGKRRNNNFVSSDCERLIVIFA